MGAFDCSDYAIGKYKNAKEAYKELVADLIRKESVLKDQLSHALQELNDLYMLVEQNPNNMKLGKVVRQYYWDNTEDK